MKIIRLALAPRQGCIVLTFSAVRRACQPPPSTFSFSSAEGLWAGLPADRTHRGEQVQHLRLGGVAQQEEAHVRGAQRQRQTDEGEENPPEKHGHALPAHRRTPSMTEPEGVLWTYGGATLD